MELKPKYISDRVSCMRKPDELTVVISQEIPKKKEALLFSWLMMWIVLGGVYIYYWFISKPESDQKLFFMVVLAFWAFFLYRMGKVFFWRRAGRELIRIKEETITIKNAFGKYGKARLYQIENIKKFGTIPYDFTKFGQFLDRSFWEMGGETIGFEHFNKGVAFGKQLSENESKQLAKIVLKAMKEIPENFQKKINDIRHSE
ncbi:MAG: hypothetical protein ACJAU0_000470 [Flavobacteriales bacterium]|jgi:hypothetical protein